MSTELGLDAEFRIRPNGDRITILPTNQFDALIQRLRDAEAGKLSDEFLRAEFEALRAEFGTGEGLPDVTPEGQILCLSQRNAKLQARIAQLERVQETAQKVISARRQAAYFSPGDKAQPWLAVQIQEGLAELDAALAAVEGKS